MKHCDQGAKPLQRFGGAAPECRGLGAQPRYARGLGSVTLQGARNPRDAASRHARNPGGSARQVYSERPRGSAPQGSLSYAVNRTSMTTATTRRSCPRRGESFSNHSHMVQMV